MSKSTLPPYLTSGASSRSHHAFLAQLQAASSSQEEDNIISKEIMRCRDSLSGRNMNQAKIADTMVILLHCAMIRNVVEEDLEFALVWALGLAEGGSNLRERRIGYLYLTERLPLGHELGLMLINTIRKDLASNVPSQVLLALHTIVKLPSSDLRPAVEPLLISKLLLRHTEPAVRQRTLEALIALHSPEKGKGGEKGNGRSSQAFPLSMSKIVKLLRQEEDPSVLAVILRLIRELLINGVHEIQSEEERVYLVESVLQAVDDSEGFGQIDLIVLRTLAVLIEGGTREKIEILVNEWVEGKIRKIGRCRGWRSAFLLESCHLVAATSASSLEESCLSVVSTLLHPPDTPSSSSAPTSTSIPPNDHVLALRCISILPKRIWESELGEVEMGNIMEGVNHADPTIRKLTLVLLRQLDPSLLHITFQNHLTNLSAATDLFLPLNIPKDFSGDRKLQSGLYETASRALQIAKVQISPESSEDRDDADRGSSYARAVAGVLQVLYETQLANGDVEIGVWEDGVRQVLEVVQTCLASLRFAESFSSTLAFANWSISPTVVTIRATVTCQFGDMSQLSDPDTEAVMHLLLQDLQGSIASVQEVVLVAIVSVLGRLPYHLRQANEETFLNALGGLRRSARKHIRKRCDQVTFIIEAGRLDEVLNHASSRSLPDLLAAITSIELPKKAKEIASPVSSTLSPPKARSPSLSASVLRYDAYESPLKGITATPRSAKRGEKDSRLGGRGMTGSVMSAGDYALFDAEDELDLRSLSISRE